MFKNRFSLLTILGLLAVFLTGSLHAEIHPISGRDIKVEQNGSGAGRSTAETTLEPSEPVSVYYDLNEPTIVFAARDLQKILMAKGHNPVSLKSIADMPPSPEPLYIVIAKSNSPVVLRALQDRGGKSVGTMHAQDYALRRTDKGGNLGYWAIGGDRVGAMYGGIHLAEIAAGGSLADVQDEDQSPYIARRGLKFNIPLDERQPSHDDRGTAAQTNIINVWDWAFWQEYLDLLARQRYNVLSLWNKHPFPSMVKVADYPDVALDDVYNKSGKVKDMTIDEKIALWNQIFDYAYDRGIEIYIITWNIHMNGAEGKHGISENSGDNDAKDYMRKTVKQVFLTYPRLAGIGVTAGENMWGMSDTDKEQWLWENYGRGIMDLKLEQPNRSVRFIHRYWLTDFDEIESRFRQLPDGYDMSFKYHKARLYSFPTSKFAENELLDKLPSGMSSWWNLRNDDIYNLRWGDPEYVKQFILELPKGDLTVGYYMGSDRYAWVRESISKNPLTPRQLENEKHWYSFLLWGRLGYDPNTPVSLLKGLIKYRFPSVSADVLYDAWQAASRTIPLVNQVHWWDWDYLWWVEACISSGDAGAIDGYHDINSFIDRRSMPYSGITSISDFVGGNNSGTSPLEVADQIEQNANTALTKIAGVSDNGNLELKETIGDIKAQAYIGLYYASKIRGAVDLARFRRHNNSQYKTSAVTHLEKALAEWKNYAGVLDSQYNKMVLAFNGLFDWHELENDVQKDISIARNAK